MHNRFFTWTRLQVPVDKFVHHRFKVAQSLTVWDSVVRPTFKVNLSDSLHLIAIWNLHFSSVKIWTFFNIFNQVNFYVFRLVFILTYVKFNSFFVIRPKLVALWSVLFHCFTCWYDHRHIVFYQHLPKVICRFRQRSLRSYDFCVSNWITLECKRRVYVACVDVVSIRSWICTFL